jgi:hypothetical protein
VAERATSTIPIVMTLATILQCRWGLEPVEGQTGMVTAKELLDCKQYTLSTAHADPKEDWQAQRDDIELWVKTTGTSASALETPWPNARSLERRWPPLRRCAVAQSHGLNANLVHKWRRERKPQVAVNQATPIDDKVASAFVALQLSPPPTPQPAPDIGLQFTSADLKPSPEVSRPRSPSGVARFHAREARSRLHRSNPDVRTQGHDWWFRARMLSAIAIAPPSESHPGR